MNERPELNKELDAIAFRSFYYLKRELVSFCRKNGLPTSGSKAELTDRIAYVPDTGKVLKSSAKRKTAVTIGALTEDTVIEPNIVCSEKRRAFFCEKTCTMQSYAGTAKNTCRENADMSAPTLAH